MMQRKLISPTLYDDKGAREAQICEIHNEGEAHEEHNGSDPLCDPFGVGEIHASHNDLFLACR